MIQPHKCFVTVTPNGALSWISQPGASLARSVIEVLLDVNGERPMDVRALSSILHAPIPDLTKTLFSLIHAQAINVTTTPAVHHENAERPLGLDAACATLVGGRGRAVLAGSDGLCVAGHGCSDFVCDLIASGIGGGSVAPSWSEEITLVFARDRFVFCALDVVDKAHAGWIPLIRMLLRMCGALPKSEATAHGT